MTAKSRPRAVRMKTTPLSPSTAPVDFELNDRSQRRADNVDLAIAQRLRAAREAAGLTQHEFADKLEVSYQQLQKYERGINRISGSVLFRSAHILGVDAADLFPASAGKQEPGVGTRRSPVGRRAPLEARVGSVAPTAVASPTVSSDTASDDQRTSELEDFADICDRILKLQSPRLMRALLAVVQQSVDDKPT